MLQHKLGGKWGQLNIGAFSNVCVLIKEFWFCRTKRQKMMMMGDIKQRREDTRERERVTYVSVYRLTRESRGRACPATIPGYKRREREEERMMFLLVGYLPTYLSTLYNTPSRAIARRKHSLGGVERCPPELTSRQL